MANYDLNHYLRQMESFRAADHARENLVNVSGAAGEGASGTHTNERRNLSRNSQVSYENMQS